MTPKEKAKELYNKYKFVYIQHYTSKHEVKQCAIICVDEIMNAIGWHEMEEGVERDDYWDEVKKEIERL